MSIKNQVATSITHIHVSNKPVIKTIHHTVNVMTSEAEIFTMRCGVNQTTQIIDIHHIIVIMDSIHAVKRIFDSSIYLYKSNQL